MTNEPGEKHGKAYYTKIQYKLWAEALDIGTHQSKEEPLCGPIWGNQKLPKKHPERSQQCWYNGISLYVYDQYTRTSGEIMLHQMYE